MQLIVTGDSGHNHEWNAKQTRESLLMISSGKFCCAFLKILSAKIEKSKDTIENESVSGYPCDNCPTLASCRRNIN